MQTIGERLLRVRVLALAVGHAALFAGVYWLAFCLRFDFAVPRHALEVFWLSLPWLLTLKCLVFFVSNQFHGWWRFVTFADLVALLRAVLVALVAVAAIDYFLVPSYQIPRSVLILDSLLGLLVLGALRASWRLLREHFHPMLQKKGSGALMVGVDHSSAILAYQIQSHLDLGYRIRGFVTTHRDAARPGSRLGQIPVLGPVEDIREIATAADAKDVLVMAGTLSGPQLRLLMDVCRQSQLNLKIIRSAADQLNANARVPIRDIEISDLLRRDPVELDAASIGQMLEGRRVMVTGAGGSIGSEICRQILRFNPRMLILVGRGENRIFAVENELRRTFPAAILRACIGDVTNQDRMRGIFEEYRPEVVFHAAAHKHVPLMEHNVNEAIRNNVFGTKCVADLSDEMGVEGFVAISTDKVVNPTSVMGVSKQLAERYVHALSQGSSTRFMVVRFGNVLGSNGSVVPIFQEQIRNGGPITVTDPRMTRFFMTIPEASQLVLQAAAMGRGGEIFVLEMGEPVKIVDLARDLIRLSGLPEHAVEITFTGIRPGEKLYEELYFDDEQTLPTSHRKVRAAYHRPFLMDEAKAMIDQLSERLNASDESLREKLHELVPEYTPPPAPAQVSVSIAGEAAPPPG
jgi:FlaA1/EpsC-like NDP-sugar epimerase